MLADHRHDLVLGQRPDDRLLQLAVLEQQDRGDTPDTVFCRNGPVRIYVDLADLELVLVFDRDLVHDRGDHFAGAAPYGPEIHDRGQGGFKNFVIEVRVGDGDDGIGNFDLLSLL